MFSTSAAFSLAATSLLAAAAACSSTSGGPVAPPSENTDAGAVFDGSTPVVVGPGMVCPTQTNVWTATKLSLDVEWPSTVATQGGTGPLYIWLLSNYTVNGTALTGTTQTCGNQTPPFTLTTAGSESEAAPSGTSAQLQISIPTSVWSEPGMPTTMTTGQIGAWNIGSSFETDPVITVNGITPSSMYAQASTPWPSLGSAIPTTDLTTEMDGADGGPGNQGITATPLTTNGYYLPTTALTMDGSAPKAKELYVVVRTELSLYGASTSCTEGAGFATVKLLNNHVIGCQLVDGTACNSAQVTFVDINTTQYVSKSGTYKSVQLPAEAGTPTCADVIAMLP